MLCGAARARKHTNLSCAGFATLRHFGGPLRRYQCGEIIFPACHAVNTFLGGTPCTSCSSSASRTSLRKLVAGAFISRLFPSRLETAPLAAPPPPARKASSPPTRISSRNYVHIAPIEHRRRAACACVVAHRPPPAATDSASGGAGGGGRGGGKARAPRPRG